MKIVVTSLGVVRCVDADDVVDCFGGTAKRTRASHVVPCNAVLRWAFVTLRNVFGDDGRVAAFTRRWPCLWRVDLSPVCGPVLGPYMVRDDAIVDEVLWIEKNVL